MIDVNKDTPKEIDKSNPVENKNIQNEEEIIRDDYIPVSEVCNTSETVAPIRMLYEMNKNLQGIDRKVRGIDYFVMEKLHYDDMIELCNAFNAEQVDAIAAAINQIEKGKAIIIGDMTGIGKGRIAAGILRYAKYELGKKPIFITERPNLYSDIYRDIIAIGLDAGVPLRFKGAEVEKTVEVSRQVVIDAMKEDIANDDFFLEGFDEDLLFKRGKSEYTEQAIEAYRQEYFPDQVINVFKYETNKNYDNDIRGKKRFVPYIINGSGSKTDIKDSDGNILYKGLPSNQNYEILSKKALTKEYDCVLATYSQFSSMKAVRKVEFIMSLAKDNVVVMDESHNASGTSRRGAILQNIVKETKGLAFLSATYAKRPDNMPIYAVKTNIADAELDSDELIDAIRKGGFAMQEILSSQLVSEGQMIRRERSYEGIDINYVTLDESCEVTNPNFNLKNVHYAIADKFLSIIRQIINFVFDEVNPVIQEKREKHIIQTCGEKLGNMILFGNKEEREEAREQCKADLYNNSPYLGVFTIVNQLFFSIKADAVAEWAIYRMKQGKKPIIALASTLESVLDYAMSEADGESIDIDFSVLLKRRLDKSLEYTVIDKEENSEKKILDISELSPSGQATYEGILEKISNLHTGITISPIDYIKKKIADAGFTVEEVTGRNKIIEFDKKETSGKVRNRKVPNTTDVFNGFNDNIIDCLIINQAGATGSSAHSIKTKKVTEVNYDKDGTPIVPTSLENRSEVKQRVMIILQAELDVNKEIQKRGRIYRTGQVFNPIYDYIFSAIPAEKRLSMMLRKKLKSLDANTSSNQKQSGEILDVVDFLNEYGDEVVADILSKNNALNAKLGQPVSFAEVEDSQGNKKLVPKGSITDLAYNVTGRVALLNTDEQEEFYNEVVSKYKAYEDKLKQENRWNLEVDNLDLQAKTLEKDAISVGNPEKQSVFGGATFVEKCEIDNIRKPFTKLYLNELVSAALTIKDVNGNSKEVSVEEYRQYLHESIDQRAKAEYDYMKPLLQKQKEREINGLSKDKRVLKIKNEEKRNEFLREETKRLAEIYDSKIEQTENIWSKAKRFKSIVDFFLPKNIIVYYHDGQQQTFEGLSLGIKMYDGKWLNYSDFVLRIAFPSTLRHMELSFYNMDEIQNLIIETSKKYSEKEMYIVGKNLYSDWDEEIKNSSSDRIVRYIITGNILKAYGIPELKNRQNKLISYSTNDKRVKKGILMYDSFNPNELTIKVPIDAAKNIAEKSIGGRKYLEFGDEGIVALAARGTYYMIKRRSTRLKRFHIEKNNELANYLNGSWQKNRDGDYENEVSGSKNIEAVIEILYQLGLAMNMKFDDWKAIANNYDTNDRFSSEDAIEVMIAKYNEQLEQYEKEKSKPFKEVPESVLKKMEEMERELYELRKQKENNKALRFFVASLDTAKKFKQREFTSMRLGGEFESITLAELQQDDSLSYISDITEVKDILTHFVPKFNEIDELTGEPYYNSIGGLFVKFENGNITQVYVYEGSVPSLDKPAYEVYPKNQYFNNI